MTACRQCGGPLPVGSRSDRRFCSLRCRVAAFRGAADAVVALPAPPICPACDRPFGRLEADRLILNGGRTGGFVLDGDVRRWNIYRRGEVWTTLPALVACPHCRAVTTVG